MRVINNLKLMTIGRNGMVGMQYSFVNMTDFGMRKA